MLIMLIYFLAILTDYNSTEKLVMNFVVSLSVVRYDLLVMIYQHAEKPV